MRNVTFAFDPPEHEVIRLSAEIIISPQKIDIPFIFSDISIKINTIPGNVSSIVKGIEAEEHLFLFDLMLHLPVNI